MARTPQIRVSYNNDAQYLLRLCDAVERDPKRSKEWKADVCSHLTKLAHMFLSDTVARDEQSVPKEIPPETSKPRRKSK